MLKAGGQPVNLTGYTVLAAIYRDEKRDEKLADLTVQYPDRTQGIIKVRLERALTRSITSSGYWDMLVIEPNGDGDYWLAGPAPLDVGLTDNV